MSRARRIGSSRDQAAAAIASRRRRASYRWPRFCQNRHVAKREVDRGLRVLARYRAIERDPDVVVGVLEALEPARAGRRRSAAAAPRSANASEPARRGARSSSARWPRPSSISVGELADGVEHLEPRLGRVLDRPDQALVREREQAVDDVLAELRRRAADGLGGLELDVAGEDRQPVQQQPARLVEDVVAPGDRAAEGLLALWQVARAGGEQVELVLEAGEDRVGRRAA